MPAQPRRRPIRRRWWIAGGAALLALLLVLALLVTIRALAPGPGHPVADPEPMPSAGASFTRSAPRPPFSVVDREPLTLPQTFRFAQGEFYLQAGSTYLVSFDLSTVKPEDAPGVGMYLGVSFSCITEDGRGVGSIGGTENLLPAEPVSYVNHLLIEPQADGVHSCSIRVNAPYDDVAAAGTTIDLTAHWRVTEIDGSANQAAAEERLPQTITPGRPEVAIQQVIPVGQLEATSLKVLSSLHVTTCTGVNGSTENGRTWCATDDVNGTGSSFDVTTKVDVIGADGSVCAPLEADAQSIDIDKWRHHQLIPLELAVDVPGSLCGDSLRVSVVIENRGPASLVVHESNSSLITVADG